MNIAILLKQPSKSLDLTELNKKFPIILEEKASQDYDFLLIANEDDLSLQQTSEKNFKPLQIDFSNKAIRYRINKKNQELLIKAIGINNLSAKESKFCFTILDATAGLGLDAFILASAGYQMTLVEKNPIIAALLKNGIEKANKIHELSPIVKKMMLIESNSIDYMKKLNKKPDVIYLDPMFPERKKSAKVKKEMQILKTLLMNEDQNLKKLFEIALKTAKKRVVVKRPRLGNTITNQKPDIQFLGKACRFDVYLKKT